MCGIAGMLGKDIDFRNEREMIWKMSESLKMRGPDERGEYITRNAALIHRRLSIIAPSAGSQPMRFGKYIIVYNGEIYNTEELRRELRFHGYIFDSSCDTEVVLKSYHMWGKACAERLNGIFAFAIYNMESEELFMCRDRIGVKPLFYSHKNGIFAFASRTDTLLCVKGIEPVCDENGLNEIFMLGPAKTMGKTVFKDIFELKPAEYLYYKDGKITKDFYWKLKAEEFCDNEVQAQEHTHYLVSDAIRRQLVSDVSVCTFLSGGLDSSIISKVASDYMTERGEILDTFSVDYRDNDKYFEPSLFQPNKDSDYINMISDYIDSDHHNIILNNTTVADALIDSTMARGCPGFTDIDSSLLLFCREVVKKHKVALSGECADEIFGGYPWYHREEILFEEVFPWSRSTRVRHSVLANGFLKHGDEYARNAYLQTIKRADFLDSDSRREKRMREMFVLNMDWFMQTLLCRKDAMSMQSSLEVRVPFCDYRIVEYAYNMPWSIKSFGGREKGILRKAFENELPEVITWRKKSPYPKTFNPDYVKAVCDMVSEVMKDKSCPLYEMINKQTIDDLIQNPNSLSEPWYGQLMRGPQVLAYIVQIYAWIRKYNVEFDI
ncbi:asparagine synthase (glutamine-hydrolyzing) [uncultured Eubacterium sp.]|uniref:asparagine synthase (glutamine-hydrolyzing) n=1 Tax=uncultured Eubacterium sp. TaxID=165185 RepID=UPI0015A81598|nr:asparagine synthase (glutamine-hydrolyzing) [uncultured Eubacterium sp.]